MKTIHYLCHTHWDREWLRSSDASRIRLVYLFDQLLEIMETDSHYKYFTFDGQTAALEDYLTLKPYQREKIKKYVSEGRIFIGPWYTQPDMFLASGESLLRNLLVGSNIARDMGHCMNIGWIPDAFGQIAKTPQIFKELGVEAVFAWRGFDYEAIDDSIFMWRAPNGQEVLTIHYPLGYGYYRYLPENPNEAYQDIMDTATKATKRFKDGELLFMGGSDYAFPLPSVPATIASIKEKVYQQGYQLEQSNPEKYVAAIKKTIKQSNRPLQVYQGEARSAALGRIHAGISSTRIDIKNQMKYYETLLPQVIEPMGVMNQYLGAKTHQEIMNYYWKIIFKNQFHDSAYGSSPDTVNQTVTNRLLNLRHGLHELLWMYIKYISEQADFSTLSKEDDIVVLYNTLPYYRNDLVFINIITKYPDFVLKDQAGNCIPYVKNKQDKPVSSEIEYYNGIANFHDGGEIIEGTKYRIQIQIEASLLKPMSYQVLQICYHQTNNEPTHGDVSIVDEHTFENTYLHVQINKNGSLEVTNKQTGTIYSNVHYFEEKGDDGDEYNYSPPIQDCVFTTLNATPKISLVEASSLEVKYKIVYLIETPKECKEHIRSDETAISTITSYVSLSTNSSRLSFETTIDNHAKDHMIRAVFIDAHQSLQNISQDHFGIMTRNNRICKQRGIKNGATEEELPIYPMQHFVMLAHQKETYALISGGPCEYEIYDNQKIALTLLRAVGKFGKADLVVRPGRSSGYRLDAPSAQLLKPMTSRYALYFDKEVAVEKVARETSIFNVPVQSRHINTMVRNKNHALSWQQSFLTIEQGLELLTMKKSEDGKYQVLRILNPSLHAVEGKWVDIPKCVTTCYLSTIKEEIKERIEINKHRIYLPKIERESFITILLK